MSPFARYIGIDYSGAETPDSSCKGLRLPCPQHRQFLRVEEGAHENGVFQSHRILNGDQTDWGLDFGSDSEVLRVALARY
jgi:Domain of unknown function (DUF5597)